MKEILNLFIENRSLDTTIFTIFLSIIFIYVIYHLIKSVCLVPTQKAYIVERLGNYSHTLNAGLHSLIPFIDKVAYTLDLKEESIDVPPQECFTKDEVKVEVDGVVYISVIEPVKAVYGITDYSFAAIQLAQTTTRSVIGTLDLDKTFEERSVISAKVVEVLERAGRSWGIKVHRYEIKNISPPKTVQTAMEKQVNAERERRALIAESEGKKQSLINISEGIKQEMINLSEGEMQKMINEAQGVASEVISVATATSESIAKLASAINENGGEEAVYLQVANKLIAGVGKLANKKTQIILPADLTRPYDLFKNFQLDFSLFQTKSEDPTPPLSPLSPTSPISSNSLAISKIVKEGKELFAFCPNCGKKFNVTKVFGNEKFDLCKDLPGQQGKCPSCGTLFTLA